MMLAASMYDAGHGLFPSLLRSSSGNCQRRAAVSGSKLMGET